MKFQDFKKLDLPTTQQFKIKGGNDSTTDLPTDQTTDYIATQDIVNG